MSAPTFNMARLLLICAVFFHINGDHTQKTPSSPGLDEGVVECPFLFISQLLKSSKTFSIKHTQAQAALRYIINIEQNERLTN